jgi:hypothetical protein
LFLFNCIELEWDGIGVKEMVFGFGMPPARQVSLPGIDPRNRPVAEPSECSRNINYRGSGGGIHCGSEEDTFHFSTPLFGDPSEAEFENLLPRRDVTIPGLSRMSDELNI